MKRLYKFKYWITDFFSVLSHCQSHPMIFRIMSRIHTQQVFNKTGTSKVGAISKAQNAQKTFFKKKLDIFVFFSFRKCRIVPKNVKGGDPLGFINIYSVAKYQKTRKRDSFETLKNFRKKSHNAEKNRTF